MSSKENLLIDVIVRTKNSEELLKGCLQSIINEIPVRQIIIVDGGSTDRTLEIASNFNNVSIYAKPELNLGQATKFAFEMAKTEWVAIIDSDVLLRKGWFEQMKENMYEADAVESCRIDHYVFDTQADCTKNELCKIWPNDTEKGTGTRHGAGFAVWRGCRDKDEI